MRAAYLLTGLTGLGLVACKADGTAHDDLPAMSAALAMLPSRAEIIAAAFDPDYRVPDDFFVDERADTPRSYTLYHVHDESGSYELCSDDYQEAADWEAADNERRRNSGHAVGSYENDKYFEFIRELAYRDAIGNSQELTSPGFARVFKCATLNRNGVDVHVTNGYAGMLNPRLLTVGIVSEFAEYLWQFTYFGTPVPKVLDSYATERRDTVRHALLTATVLSMGPGECDRIEVAEWIHTADKDSGELNREFRFLFAIEATDEGGQPRECD